MKKLKSTKSERMQEVKKKYKNWKNKRSERKKQTIREVVQNVRMKYNILCFTRNKFYRAISFLLLLFF